MFWHRGWLVEGLINSGVNEVIVMLTNRHDRENEEDDDLVEVMWLSDNEEEQLRVARGKN